MFTEHNNSYAIFYIMLFDHLWEKFLSDIMSGHPGFDKYEDNYKDAEDVV